MIIQNMQDLHIVNLQTQGEIILKDANRQEFTSDISKLWPSDIIKIDF